LLVTNAKSTPIDLSSRSASRANRCARVEDRPRS
jgi:hypothetical protein